MSGAMVVGVVIAVLCAVGVVWMLLVEQRPPEGWAAWLRASVRAWRSEELRSEDVRARSAEVRDTSVDEIFTLGPTPDEPAYARLGELHARRQTRSVTRR
ncbi:MAG: hypothetical protein ACYC1Z_12610 [Georgenia sp.]